MLLVHLAVLVKSQVYSWTHLLGPLLGHPFWSTWVLVLFLLAPTSPKIHGSTMSRYLAPQSYHWKTFLQFGRGNNKTCIILCKSRFIFYIGCFSVIVYLKNPIRIFFNREIETCDGYLHLITSRCIENEEYATNGYISRQLRTICIPA